MVQEQRPTTHPLLGCTIGVLTLAQAAAGKYVHELDLATKRRRWYVSTVHVLMGKGLLCAAAYQIWLGIEMFNDAYGGAWAVWRVVYVCWVGLLVLVFAISEVCLQWRRCRRTPEQIAADEAAQGSAPPCLSGRASHRSAAVVVCVAACAGQNAEHVATDQARHADTRYLPNPPALPVGKKLVELKKDIETSRHKRRRASSPGA
jgi:hypothetical protein